MTNQEIIEWQRQYREWSLTRLGSVCERALWTAYNDGHDGNSDVCSIKRARVSAEAAKVAAEELRTLLRKQQSDLDAAQARIAELESALREVIGMWPEHGHGHVKLPPMSVQREVFGCANEALTGEPR